MIIQGRKEQRQFVIKHKTKIYATVRIFAITIGRRKCKQTKEMKRRVCENIQFSSISLRLRNGGS